MSALYTEHTFGIRLVLTSWRFTSSDANLPIRQKNGICGSKKERFRSPVSVLFNKKRVSSNHLL